MLALLDDRRIIGGNDRFHFVGVYRREATRIFFRAFVSFHGGRCGRSRVEAPYEAEGIGEISADERLIDYVARIVGEPDSQFEGSFTRIAEVPNFREVFESALARASKGEASPIQQSGKPVQGGMDA